MLFVKYSNNKKISKAAYFSSKSDLILSENDFLLSLKTSQQEILNKIATWISEGSAWSIQEIQNHYTNVVKYKPMNGSSYIKLPIELQSPKKGLINIQNKDKNIFFGVISDI